MNLLTQIKHKTQKGEEVIMDIGAKASNVLPENFVEQKERSNLTYKDKLPVIFGKLSKWYADLRPVAWSGSYSDLTNKPTIPEGSAANYQVANNDTTEAEGFVADARIVRTHGLEIDGLSRDLGGLSFGQDADGSWGYRIGGADPVIPFKSSKVAMGGFKFLGNNGNPNGATVDVGFKPDFIMYGFLGGSDITKAFYNGNSGNDRTLVLWWTELQKEFIWDSGSSNPPKCIRRSFPTGPSTGNRLALQEVTDTGFKVYGGYGSGAAFYVCIKLE